MAGHDIVLVSLNSRHVTIADLDKQKIVASATLLIEYKMLRNCGKVYFLLLQSQMHQHPDDFDVGYMSVCRLGM